jgi:hypothetical protein
MDGREERSISSLIYTIGDYYKASKKDSPHASITGFSRLTALIPVIDPDIQPGQSALPACALTSSGN